MRMETHFHMKDFALSLTLKQRLKATRKWPIRNHSMKEAKRLINEKILHVSGLSGDAI